METATIHPIQEVSELDIAFGGSIENLMPKYADVPEEFRRGGTKWNKVVNKWFFGGLEGVTFVPKEGVDQSKALRHIAAIMRSFEPKHEHKEAGCAYLFDQWFEDVKGL